MDTREREAQRPTQNLSKRARLVETMSKRGLSRRRFLQAAGALTGGLLLGNGIPASSHADSSIPELTIPPPTHEPAEPLTLSWNDIHEKARQLPQAEGLQEKLRTLQEGYEYRTNRINRLIELTYNGRKDQHDNPFLITQIKKITATQTSGIAPEQLLPFLREKQEVAKKFGELESAVGTLAQNQPGTFANVIDTVDRQLEDPMLQIPEKRQFPAQRLTIQPTSPIESEEAQLEFERNKKQIEAFIDTFPLFRKIYSNILLYKDSYGIPKPDILKGKGGITLSSFTKASNLPVCMMNLDHIDTNVGSLQKQFAHEAFGHAGSILPFPKYERSIYEEGNKTLAEALNPEGYIERLTFELEILNNPDWADHSATLTDILNDQQISEDTGPLSTADFNVIIRSYPREYTFDPNVKRVVLRDIMRELQIPALPATQAFVDKHSKDYSSFYDFIIDSSDALQKEAATGNVEAKIILWGLTNFPDEFARFAPSIQTMDLPDDSDMQNQKEVLLSNTTGEEYALYCKTFVTNMALYQAFMNGTDTKGEGSIRQLIPQDAKHPLALALFSLRIRYLTELWAEGVAFSHTQPTVDQPPYREGLKQLAWLLVDEGKAA